MTRTRLAGLVALNLLAALLAVGLAALGTWQVHRRAWKLDLIQRVEDRMAAPPVAAPGPDGWSSVSEEAEGYRRVVVDGTYEAERSVLVQAVTEYGAGFWVMTPLTTSEGWTVLINRGFVPADRRDSSTWRQETGPAAVTGLLRLSEPGGAFLRTNDPTGNRWYSRDVDEIAKAMKLANVAPYFIDASARSDPKELPVAGLTVVRFHNNHLVYAITWFVLAAMTLGAIAYVDRDAWRRRRADTRDGP